MREKAKKQCYYKKEYIWYYNETTKFYNIGKSYLNNLLQQFMLNLFKKEERS